MSLDRKELMRRFPLWETFSDELLRLVGEAMEAVSYDAGDPIIRRGELGRQFSVMVSGRADVRVLTQAGTVITGQGWGQGLGSGSKSCIDADNTRVRT